MIKIKDLINQALDEEMARNGDVYIIGEEVGKSGGPNGLTKNLIRKYPNRVIDTPISEMGFTGLAVGSSYLGLRPVVDFMTMNFALQSIDHIINSCAKTLYMSTSINCPIVFRGPNGFSKGFGAQHTQDFCSLYGNIPGLKVVCPYTGKDHKGLLKSAIRDDNPVVYLENEMLYKNEVHNVDSDYIQQLDKSVVEKNGTDCTIIGIGLSMQEVFKAEDVLNDINIDCEIINLVSIRPLDKKTILDSVNKTKKLVVVDYGYPLYGVASEISALVGEVIFDKLEFPVVRLQSKDVPTPYCKKLEDLCYPKCDDIVEAVKKMFLNK